ncbi:MAG: DUF92 domain-containing protein [Thermoanaerobaculia bacterium]
MTEPLSRISAGEWLRKLVHGGMGLFAMALRVLPWPVAALCAFGALLFNFFAMPAVGRTIYRDRGKKRDSGIVAYPAAVFLVIVLFRHNLEVAAAIWGMMALGDPAASIVGKLAGGPKLPWNPAKTWSGLAAYAVFGGAAGSLLLAFVGRGPAGAAFSAFAGFALLGACLESIDTGFDDNLTPGIGVACAWAAIHLGPIGPATPTLAGPPVSVAGALAVNAGIAAVSVALRIVSLSGGISGAVAGFVVLHFGGWGAYAVLWAFFLFGTIASRLGYSRKEKLGTAQADRARRGVRHVVANVAVGAGLSFAMGSRARAEAIPILAVALAGAFAAALADTFGTELGTLYGRRPFLFSRMRTVRPGTRGAVSIQGIGGGLLGAFLIAAAGAAAGLLPVRLAWIVALAGLLGSLAESFLIDLSARAGISADHEFCNAFNTLVGAAVAFELAACLDLGRIYLPFAGLA